MLFTYRMVCIGIIFRVLLYSSILVAAGRLAAFGQLTVSPDSFTVKQGLSQGFVSDICQDKDGFIWMGTMDGLNRYDGYGVQVLRSNPDAYFTLPENYITEVEEDGAGNLWVGTYSHGLYYFDKRQERFYEVKASRKGIWPGKNIVKLTYHAGFLFCKDEQQLAIYDVRQFEQKYRAGKAPLPDFGSGMQAVYHEGTALAFFINPSEFNALFCNFLPDCSLWYGRSDTLTCVQVNRANGAVAKRAIAYTKAGIPPGAAPTVLQGSLPHELVICFKEGFVLYNLSTNEVAFAHRFTPEQRLIYGPGPFQIIADTAGRVFIPAKFGHWLFNSRTRQLLPVYNAAIATPFGGKSQIVSRDGFFMMGSGGYGLYYYNTRTGAFKGMATQGTPIALLPNNRLVVNVQSDLVAVDATGSAPQVVINAKQLFGAYYYFENAWQDAAQPEVLWLVARQLLAKKAVLGQYNMVTQHFVAADSLLHRQRITSQDKWMAHTDKSGRLWQCYETGEGQVEVMATHLNSKKVEGFWLMPSEGLLEGSRLPLEQVASTDSLSFFATRFGLFELNRVSGTWQHYRHQKGNRNSLPSNKVRVVCCDPRAPGRYVWIGTDGSGLCLIDRYTKQCTRITTEDGLPSNVIYGILPDDAGNLWLSTTRGLCAYTPNGGFVRRFSSYDGLRNDEFNNGQYLKLYDGRLVFGGVNGQTLFAPGEVLQSKVPAGKTMVTGISLGGSLLSPTTDSGLLQQAIPYMGTITLPYAKNFFTLHFALLNYVHASQKQYRYKLLGLQENWIETGELNQATFTNLDPGTYTFRVNARLAAGEWHSDEAVLVIKVLPPWYNTTWFIAAMLLLVAGMVYGVYRYRLHQQLQVHQMRNMIASDLHDEIGSTISSITVYSDVLMQQLDNERHKNLAGRISSSSRNILISMSDIVWTINPKNDAFANIILRMQSYAHELLDAQQKRLHFQVQPEVETYQLNMKDRKNFYLIFKEALNNAVKYANCTEVHIAISIQRGGLHFSLSDNGQGFDANAPSEGNGIANMQRRAKDLKGRFSLHSKPREGTMISLWFPIKN
ncbi:MAG: ATP-binding protein [Chitinophagaceae bacterium]|nr:ATP-binding protein [Chitinophagaceae bacterium]